MSCQKILPVLIQAKGSNAEWSRDFLPDIYYNRLSTALAGRTLLYTPVCTTTLDIVDSLTAAFPGPAAEGVAVVAGKMINGRGRVRLIICVSNCVPTTGSTGEWIAQR